MSLSLGYSRMLEHHINVMVFLAAHGLAFRGHNESMPSSKRGNFIELLDLLGDYSLELRKLMCA